MGRCGGKELLNLEREEHMNLCAYLIKDKFIHVHLLKGVVLSGVGACDSSQSRCEPPPQTEAPPKRLEVPKEQIVKKKKKSSMNHETNVNIVCYPIREIKHVNLSFNC